MAQLIYVLPDGYGKAIVTIAALFVAVHAPSWIRAWFRSRFERTIPAVEVKIPAVSAVDPSLQAISDGIAEGCESHLHRKSIA